MLISIPCSNEKAAKFSVPLPKVRGIAEEVSFVSYYFALFYLWEELSKGRSSVRSFVVAFDTPKNPALLDSQKSNTFYRKCSKL